MDNVIIAQELIYSFSTRSSKEGYMVIKIDLEKAYDRLERSFIRSILTYFGFPAKIVKLILSCVSTTSTFILVNRINQTFVSSRGIRQGDPISSYLFILCVEFLGGHIHSKCEEGSWSHLKASRGGPGFSHIFFADDLLLFAKANSKNCEAISEVLQNFCNLSGKKNQHCEV